MSDDRFEQLMSRMPEIAQAVNAFQSESVQKLAFEMLVESLGLKPSAGRSRPAESAGKAVTGKSLNTQDILAMARARVPKDTASPAESQSFSDQTPPVPEAKAAAARTGEEAPHGELSDFEIMKRDSNFLRGSLPAELHEETDHFTKDASQLLKFHGSYQQDNRDERSKTGGTKSQKSYMLMVRTKIPSGILTSEQLLAELELCDEVGNSTLRITSRQGLQLHGVMKRDLQKTVRRINDIKLTTFGACGDVERNVMCCPGPYADTMHRTVQQLALQLSKHLTPHTRAYYELWLADPSGENRELVGGNAPAKTSRCTGPGICRGSSRRPSHSRTTTALTSTPTISVFWPWCVTTRLSATTCWSAGVWE